LLKLTFSCVAVEVEPPDTGKDFLIVKLVLTSQKRSSKPYFLFASRMGLLAFSCVKSPWTVIQENVIYALNLKTFVSVLLLAYADCFYRVYWTGGSLC
jgi:hypothetical protein